MQNKIIKDSFIYVLGAFLTKAFGFFLIPIYTRFLSIEEYGILALLTVILQIISFLCVLGISSASMRYYFNPGADTDYRQQVYGNAFILLLIFPPILFLILWPSLHFLINRLLPTVLFYPFVFMILLVGLLQTLQKLVLGLFRVQKRVKKYVVYSFSFFLFQTLTIIVAVTFLGLGLRGVIFSIFAVNFLFWGIAFIILLKNLKFSFSRKICKSLLLFGIPLIPFFIFTWIHKASTRFLLERFGSLEELGIFALAAQFSGMLLFLSTSLDNAILPYYYESAQNENARNIIGRFSTNYFVFFGLLSLLTLIIAQPLIQIMADPKFHSSIIYVPLLILAGWLNINSKLFYWNLMHSKKTGMISLLSCISAVLMVGLLFLGLIRWNMGIQGVVYVMVIIGLFRNLSGFLLSQRYFQVNYDVTKSVRIFLALLCSAIIIQYLPIDTNLYFNVLIKFCVFALTAIVTLKIAKINTLKKLASIKTW